MSEDLDLDELIASGEVDAHPDAVKRARWAVLARAADAAFRTDVSYCIEMAKAGWAAKEKQPREREEETEAPTRLSPDERLRRIRASQARYRERKRQEAAAAAARSADVDDAHGAS